MKTVAFAALIALARGSTITWTGIANDEQWVTADNWHPATVPGTSDDVIINGAQGKDATVLLTQPVEVRSITVGNGDANVHFRQLAPLNVTGTVVGSNGLFEVNSGAAVLNTKTASVSGELQFVSGTLTGMFNISGFCNFGGLPAKTLDAATVSVTSTQKVAVGGAIQFKSGSTVTATTPFVSQDSQLMFIVADASTGNSVKVQGFSWGQQ